MHGWVHGKFAPSLLDISQISDAFGCSAQDVLMGNSEFATWQGKLGLSPIRQYRVRTIKDWAGIRERLQCPPDDYQGPITSVTAVARTASITRKLLVNKFPNETAKLVSRRAKWIREMKEQRLTDRVQMIHKITEQLVSRGLNPTRNRIQACLIGNFSIFSPELKNACVQASEFLLESQLPLVGFVTEPVDSEK